MSHQILTWNTKLATGDIDATDVKMQKLLTIHWGFNPESSTLRLYEHQKERGWRFISIITWILEKTQSIYEYIWKIVPWDECLRHSDTQWWGTEGGTVPSDRGRGWQDILPVARKGQHKGQHRHRVYEEYTTVMRTQAAECPNLPQRLSITK